MAELPKGTSGGRSISVGGNVGGSILVAGDRNIVAASQSASPEAVDIRSELAALRQLLASLALSPGKAGSVAGALDAAESATADEEPDKNAVGRALDLALGVAAKAEKFAELSGKIRPHVERAAAWLGEHGQELLATIGPPSHLQAP